MEHTFVRDADLTPFNDPLKIVVVELATTPGTFVGHLGSIFLEDCNCRFFLHIGLSLVRALRHKPIVGDVSRLANGEQTLVGIMSRLSDHDTLTLDLNVPTKSVNPIDGSLTIAFSDALVTYAGTTCPPVTQARIGPGNILLSYSFGTVVRIEKMIRHNH